MTHPRAFNHVGITVTDIDEGVRWYQNVLGCQVVMPPMDAREDGSHFARIVADIFGKGFKRLRIAHLSTAEGVGIELFQFYKPRSTLRKPNFDYAKTGIFHICITDPDIRGLAKKIACGRVANSASMGSRHPGWSHGTSAMRTSCISASTG